MSCEILSEFIHDHEGVQRKVELWKEQDHYELLCFKDNSLQGTRIINGHSLHYAEDAAENYVFGLYELKKHEQL